MDPLLRWDDKYRVVFAPVLRHLPPRSGKKIHKIRFYKGAYL